MTITDTQGNSYELVLIFNHGIQKYLYALEPIGESEENSPMHKTRGYGATGVGKETEITKAIQRGR